VIPAKKPTPLLACIMALEPRRCFWKKVITALRSGIISSLGEREIHLR
jgi:hypothetical protein